MKNAPTDSLVDPATKWIQNLAAAPLPPAQLPEPHTLWWQGQVLRHMDEKRRLTALLEIGEHIQIACGVAAAMALFAWLIPMMPRLAEVPGFPMISAVCGVLVTIAVLLTLWDARRPLH